MIKDVSNMTGGTSRTEDGIYVRIKNAAGTIILGETDISGEPKTPYGNSGVILHYNEAKRYQVIP